MLGYAAAEVVGGSFGTIVPPQLRNNELALLSRVAGEGRIARHETVHVHKDGRRLEVAVTLSPLRDETATSLGTLCISRDLTEQKRGDLLRRESEERFRLFANSTPVMMKSARVDGETDFFNKAWLEFTGRRMEEHLGVGWLEDVHPEDLQRCVDFHFDGFNERRLFQVEFRLRRHDGEYRWMCDTGAPRFDSEGRFVGYIGSCVDITDRRHAEELEARIKERTRIARELHDTLLQSFHGLMPRFQIAYELLPSRPEEARQQMEKAIDAATDAITEGRHAVQALRSSALEDGDLAVALRAVGEELAALEADATCPAFRVEVEGQPRNLQPDLQSQVYWIAAESLRNAFRHAQAHKIEVEIRYEDGQFCVRVHDDGKGLDPEILRTGAEGHFGLQGMRERAEIAEGSLAILSERGSGTEIELTIPACSAYSAPGSQSASFGSAMAGDG